MYLISEELRDAVTRLVSYNWADEQRDYAEQDEQGQARHVFNDLQDLANWAESADWVQVD